jgi:hypothetical protein
MYANIPQVDGPPPSPEVFHCFENLAPALLRFASRHSLLVRKYYQNQPMWTFHFLHPKGGFGSIQIHAAPVGEKSFRAAVASHWWIDDEQKCVRTLLSTKPMSFQATQPEEVVPLLEKALAHILERTQADLSSSSQTMPRKRDKDGKYVYSEFERAQRLPT